MLTNTNSAAIHGLDVKTVIIEVNMETFGSEEEVPRVIVVGLPDAAIRESRERVWSALNAIGNRVPAGRLTINLAPADLRKAGTLYDLPISLCVMAALQQLPQEALRATMIVGELALNGEVRAIQGALPIAMHAKAIGMKRLIVPAVNACEAAMATGLDVYGVSNLAEASDFLKGKLFLSPQRADLQTLYTQNSGVCLDFADVKGQESAKRAITVAAAGNHNILMIGQPGCGKTMIAKRLPGILPPLTIEEALEVTRIHSIAGTLDYHKGLIVQRPFRSPHHTVSDAGLVGGSANPRPGELSLAHNGVLFLDELPEFRRNTLEVLRQPLESGEVSLARASGTFIFPAHVMLVTAMNPCPCGYYGSTQRHCTCSTAQVLSYRNRISGPLIDRIDMHIELTPLAHDTLTRRRRGEDSASMRAKVAMARDIQSRRFKGLNIRTNAEMSGRMLDEFCALTPDCEHLLQQIITELKLSARSYDRILRVARTLADLDGAPNLEAKHIHEASSYRVLDRPCW